MENDMLTIALTKAYYPQGHGVLYEMRPDWSLVTINGIPEDWVTTEAMGAELESLFSLGSTLLPSMTPFPSLSQQPSLLTPQPTKQTPVPSLGQGRYTSLYGSVISVSSSGFIMNAGDEGTVTVQLDATTPLHDTYGKILTLSQIAPKDAIALSGYYYASAHIVRAVWVKDGKQK